MIVPFKYTSGTQLCNYISTCHIVLLVIYMSDREELYLHCESFSPNVKENYLIFLKVH